MPIEHVERVVVCNVRGKAELTNKSDRIDRIDADDLSERLRMGNLKWVFHGAPDASSSPNGSRNWCATTTT